jgi:hypothetical protein
MWSVQTLIGLVRIRLYPDTDPPSNGRWVRTKLAQHTPKDALALGVITINQRTVFDSALSFDHLTSGLQGSRAGASMLLGFFLALLTS